MYIYYIGLIVLEYQVLYLEINFFIIKINK
jgi:hypothetical protein